VLREVIGLGIEYNFPQVVQIVYDHNNELFQDCRSKSDKQVQPLHQDNVPARSQAHIKSDPIHRSFAGGVTPKNALGQLAAFRASGE
jgi:hypothetical protein